MNNVQRINHALRQMNLRRLQLEAIRDEYDRYEAEFRDQHANLNEDTIVKLMGEDAYLASLTSKNNDRTAQVQVYASIAQTEMMYLRLRDDFSVPGRRIAVLGDLDHE